MPRELPTTEELSNRRAQMFPKLTDRQIARIAAGNEERTIQAGEYLFHDGDTNTALYVVLEGEIEIYFLREGQEQLVTVHEAGNFTGEVSMLSDRRALVSGRARTKCRLIVVPMARFRSIVQTDSELSDLFMRAFILRRMGLLAGGMSDVIMIGSRHSAATLRLQEFLSRNGHPYRYVDVDVDTHVQTMLDEFHVGIHDVPVLICRGERVLKNPSNSDVADCLGFNAAIDAEQVHDLIVVGAGPSGLAAAVYAASEGLDVLVVESTAPGGQAGSSSKIENYLGFPTGISGQALAQRAFAQAEKFGARIAIARTATHLHCDSLPYAVELASGDSIKARAIVIATGAQYSKLTLDNIATFEGVGVYYGATYVEAQRCEAEEVIVVGGGNSAGQAAMYLSRTSRHVHMLVRSSGLAASMSRYLIRRIEDSPNITLHTSTQIVELEGGDHLEKITWLNDKTGEKKTLPIRHVFSMTGARPNTAWLAGCLSVDEKGFILTGGDIPLDPEAVKAGTAVTRRLFETSLPRVFAVGDVRANSVKRVASAVGEGSVCIQLVHKALEN
jgi:thioredoxin reductase (NADPH)